MARSPSAARLRIPSGNDRAGRLVKRAFFQFLAAVLILLPLFSAQAADSVPAPPEPETDSIVAVFPYHFPPYYVVDENGRVGGFGIEVLEAVAERAGLRLTFAAKESWDAAIMALARKEADVIPNMGVTEGRSRGRRTNPSER